MAKPSGNAVLHFETSFASLAAARKMGRALLRTRLAACIQLMPVESEYWWEGRLVRQKETLLMGKTRASRRVAVDRALRAQHPYEIPYVAWIPLSGVPASYARWVSFETRA